MSSDQSGEPPLLQEEADPGPETGGKDEALLGSEGGSGGMVSEAFFSELALALSHCCSLDSILRPPLRGDRNSFDKHSNKIKLNTFRLTLFFTPVAKSYDSRFAFGKY